MFILGITFVIIILLMYPTSWGTIINRYQIFQQHCTLSSFLGGFFKMMSLAVFLVDYHESISERLQGFIYPLFMRTLMVMLQDGCYVLNVAHVSSDLQVPIFFQPSKRGQMLPTEWWISSSTGLHSTKPVLEGMWLNYVEFVDGGIFVEDHICQVPSRAW